MDGRVDRQQLDRWMDGRKEGKVDGGIGERWIDRWMNG